MDKNNAINCENELDSHENIYLVRKEDPRAGVDLLRLNPRVAVKMGETFNRDVHQEQFFLIPVENCDGPRNTEVVVNCKFHTENLMVGTHV